MSVYLSDVAAGIGGFKIVGGAAGDKAGSLVADAGDVNGDGIGDLLIGAGLATYVVFGKGDGTPVDLADVAAGSGGFKIIGGSGPAASAGDVNGDGIGDLLIGAPGYQNGGGVAYVIFGKADGLAVNVNDVAAGIGGFKIVREAAGDRAGYSVASVGDLNGDGIGDLLIGAPYNGASGHLAGAAYVVFGKADGAPIKLATVAAGTGGFKIIGEAVRDHAGCSVAGVGDLNGDGIGDLLIGAWGNDAGGRSAGAAYVVFGKADGLAVDLSDVAAGDGGFKIIGEARYDHAGISVAGIGDFNGDGIGDIGLRGDRGAAYVVFGKADGTPVDLADVAAGHGGFKIIGEAGDYTWRRSIAAAGDVNGDGIDDLLIGSYENAAGGEDAGAAYVVFGKTDGLAVDLADVANDIGGFKIIGEARGDEAGRSVSAAGDLNGDGLGDLLVGAPLSEAGGDAAGAAYVVFGRDVVPPVVHTLIGSAGDDTIAGGDGDDSILGLAGNDSLSGNGGDDTLVGDAGDDTLGGGQGRDSLEGGSGADSLTGAAGIDSLNGGSEADVLDGGADNDSLFGGANADTLKGGSGDDYLDGGTGKNVLDGGSGDDTLVGNGSPDDLFGGAGDDVIYGAHGDDTVRGGDGADIAYGNSGDDHLQGGHGDDSLFGNAGNDTFYGGDGDDFLIGDSHVIFPGHPADDLMYGGDGNDTLNADAGANTLYGGNGDDFLFAGAYNREHNPQLFSDNLMYGGDGDDTLLGVGGTNTLYGGSGNDVLSVSNGAGWFHGASWLSGGDGNDHLDGFGTLHGDAGDDTLVVWGTGYGDKGDDVLYGRNSHDSLLGGLGRDSIDGHAGNDSLYGNQNADTLHGQNGDDVLDGGDGADRLTGGAGDDTMTGGNGADRFIFVADHASDGVIDHDVITDYDPLKDVIELKAGVAVVDHDVIGGNLVLTLTGGDQVELQGITTFADVVFI